MDQHSQNLFNTHQKLAYKLAHDLCREKGIRLFEWDNLENVALIGLWKAALSFRPTGQRTNFFLFARQRIKWRLNAELRHIFNGRHKIRSKTHNVPCIEAYCAKKVAPTVREKIDDLVLVDDRDVYVIRELLAGRSQESIAKDLGMHQTGVSAVLGRIRKRSA